MNLKSLIDSIIDWMITAGTVRSDRPYCDLGFDKEFTREEIAKYFTTEEQEKQFILNYREMNPVAKKGYLYIQGEINVIYSFHKGFVSRYKSRLQCVIETTQLRSAYILVVLYKPGIRLCRIK